MQDLVTRYLKKFKKEHRMRRRLGGVLLVLALMVSLGVYWQLKLTGAALTNETYCGKEEHTHDAEECYEWVLICGYDNVTESEVTVEELEALWEAELIGTEDASDEAQTDAEAETETTQTDAETVETTEADASDESDFVSTEADASEETGNESAGHTHTAECYETVTTLVCELEDTEAVTVTTEGHTHDASCYTAVLTCGLEESEGHTHSASCYATEQVLSCGLEESEGHIHSEDCYDEEGNLICGLEESEGHIHSESCYTEVETLVCGLEESEGHTHDDSCYTTELTCGLDESETVTETIEGHTHDESCYVTEQVLVCGLEDTEGEPETTDNADDAATTEDENNSENTGDTSDDAAENSDEASEEGTSDEDTTNAEITHVHSADCYQKVLVCELEEHTHTAACLSDNTADVETAEDWEATLPSDLSEDWAEAVVAIAKSQLGYTESTANFTLDEDGETQRGYTRYGAWAGNVYGDWDAMFASFCLSYAGLSTEDFPESTGANAWAVKLKELDLFADAADYVPTAGDLVFLDSDEDGKIDRVGIVISADEESDKLTVIEGDYAVETDATESGTVDAVCEVEYSLSAACVLGYGVLPEYVSEFETFTATADGVTVTVTAPTGALPDGAELIVSLIEEGSDAYNAAAEAIGYEEETVEVAATESEDGIALASEEDAETETETVATSGLAVLDISFQVDGVEVEPTEAVTVSIDASAIIPEEADASTIEVQHLTETEDGVVESTVVANATEETAGTVTVSVEEETETTVAVAEFEVESFSTFTVTWKYGNGTNQSVSISVNVYEISDESSTIELTTASSTYSIDSNSTFSVSDLVKATTVPDGYAYSYATVVYKTKQGPNTSDDTTVGDSENSVTQVTRSGGGDNPYTITYGGNGATQSANSITSVNLYYIKTSPSVIISAEGSDADGYTLTATPANFSGDPSYEWKITGESSKASINTSDDGTVTVTWNEGATVGDTVTVEVTATYTDNESQETETATDTYTLTYGQVELTVNVTYNGGTVVSGATVTLTDTDGNTVDTGTTDSAGNVTFTVTDATPYTISASYVISSSVTLTGSETIIVSGNTTETIEVSSSAKTDSSAISSTTTFPHIDIKNALATSGDSTATLSGISTVVIYNSSDQVKYTATKDNSNSNNNITSGTNEWYVGGTSASRSYSVSMTDTVMITYTVTENDNSTQYTAYIDADSTYADGTYYPVTTSENYAYRIYNYLYGTNYSSNNALYSAGVTQVDISGMSIFLVAAIVCNQASVSYNKLNSTLGLDFVLDIATLQRYSANFDLVVKKTFENSSMANGQFSFTISGATVADETEVWTIRDILQTKTNSAVNQGSDGDSVDTISFDQITYSTNQAGTYYYIIKETKGSNAGVSYDSTVYGVKVVVTVTQTTSSSTGAAGATIYTTSVVATYYKLTSTGENTYTAEEISTIEKTTDGEAIFPFTNSYASSANFTILKVDEDSVSTKLSGAEFTLTQSTTDELTNITTTTYYGTDGQGAQTQIKLTSDADGKISIEGLSDGTYTLTEVTAPDGYNLLTGGVTITVSAGTVTATYNGKSILSTDGDGNYVITVTNKAGYELPSTGGTGTMPYTLLGLLLCGGAALLYCSRRRLV